MMLLSGAALSVVQVVGFQAQPPLPFSLRSLICNHGGPHAANRSLFDVLSERVSVRDFGAQGSCWCSASQGSAVPPSCLPSCPDDTPAFNAAFSWAAEPRNKITVTVPPGVYRIDSTISIAQAELVLETGATLRRIANVTNNTAPIVRLDGTNAVLRGGGELISDNPSPRGLVNVGEERGNSCHHNLQII
eukprot:SAG31_NODE_5215_length_2670_cov_1.691949_5_plen_190_part_00